MDTTSVMCLIWAAFALGFSVGINFKTKIIKREK